MNSGSGYYRTGGCPVSQLNTLQSVFLLKFRKEKLEFKTREGIEARQERARKNRLQTVMHFYEDIRLQPDLTQRSLRNLKVAKRKYENKPN